MLGVDVVHFGEGDGGVDLGALGGIICVDQTIHVGLFILTILEPLAGGTASVVKRYVRFELIFFVVEYQRAIKLQLLCAKEETGHHDIGQ